MFKKLIVLLVFTVSFTSLAQTNAITENGDEVILFKNGTWKFVNDSIATSTTELKTNATTFTKDKKSTFLLKSKIGNFGVYINPKKWKFSKPSINSESEYEFQLKSEDLYGLMIIEKIQIPLTTLRDLAISNAKEVSTNLKVVKEEYRIVNGNKVLFMQLNGNIDGIDFSYYSYYFSNESGSVQFITYTAQSLLAEYKNDCELLLNGLVEIK